MSCSVMVVEVLEAKNHPTIRTLHYVVENGPKSMEVEVIVGITMVETMEFMVPVGPMQV